jgi:hypothetical protein
MNLSPGFQPYPKLTPAYMVFMGGHLLAMEPIFPDTNMELLMLRLGDLVQNIDTIATMPPSKQH